MRAMLKFLALFRGIITEREGLLIYSLVFRFFCFGAFNFNLAAPKTATMFVCVWLTNTATQLDGWFGCVLS